jgi:hypothetical protein
MWKKQIEYGIVGLVIGAIVGLLAGFGELTWFKKSQRAQAAPFIVSITAIVFAGIGFGVGSKMGTSVYIGRRLGIEPLDEEYCVKDGRYWVAFSKWTDKRDSQKYTLVTARSNKKFLVSALNERIIMIHDCTSASQRTIPKYHNQAKEFVFGRLRGTFEEVPKDINTLLPSVS